MLFRALLLFSVALLQYEVHSYRTSTISSITDRDGLITSDDLSGAERMKQLVDAIKSQDSDDSSSSSEEDRSRRGRQRNSPRRGNSDRRERPEDRNSDEDVEIRGSSLGQDSSRSGVSESNSRASNGGWNSDEYLGGGQSYLYPYSSDSYFGRRVPWSRNGGYIYGQNYGNSEGLNIPRGRRYMPAMKYESDDANQDEGILGRQGGRFGGQTGGSIQDSSSESRYEGQSGLGEGVESGYQNVPYGSRYAGQFGVSGSQSVPYGSGYEVQSGRQDVSSRYRGQSDINENQDSMIGGSDTGYRGGQSNQNSENLDFLVGRRPYGNSAGGYNNRDTIRGRRYLPQNRDVVQDEGRTAERVSGSTDLPTNVNGGGYLNEDTQSGENSDTYLGGNRGGVSQGINQNRRSGQNSDQLGRRPLDQIRQRRYLPSDREYDQNIVFGRRLSEALPFGVNENYVSSTGRQFGQNCQERGQYGGIDYVNGGMQPCLNAGDINSPLGRVSSNINEDVEAGGLNGNYRGRRYIPLDLAVSDYVSQGVSPRYLGLGPIGGRLLPPGVGVLGSLGGLPLGQRGIGCMNQGVNSILPLVSDENILGIGAIGRGGLLGDQNVQGGSLGQLYIPLRDRSSLPSNIIDNIRQNQILGLPTPLMLNRYNTPGSSGVLERSVLPLLKNIYGIQDQSVVLNDLVALRSGLSPVQIQEGLYVNPDDVSGILRQELQGVPRISEEQLSYLPGVIPIGGRVLNGGVGGLYRIGDNVERLGLGAQLWNNLGGKYETYPTSYGYNLRKEGILRDDEDIREGSRRGKQQKSKSWSVKYRGSRRN